jgi:hypothetical protein
MGGDEDEVIDMDNEMKSEQSSVDQDLLELTELIQPRPSSPDKDLEMQVPEQVLMHEDAIPAVEDSPLDQPVLIEVKKPKSLDLSNEDDIPENI